VALTGAFFHKFDSTRLRKEDSAKCQQSHCRMGQLFKWPVLSSSCGVPGHDRDYPALGMILNRCHTPCSKPNRSDTEASQIEDVRLPARILQDERGSGTANIS
jgi:hypothetical protein